MAELHIHAETGNTAVLSEDGFYRYRLTRRIRPVKFPLRVVFIMLNPSTADAFEDDQTIRRCSNYAKRWGYDELEVVNLYAYRTKDPAMLRAAHARGRDVVGPENLAHVDEALRKALPVVAWGGNARSCPPTPVATLLANWSPLWCLGVTADGSPRHPSRGPHRKLERWSPLRGGDASPDGDGTATAVAASPEGPHDPDQRAHDEENPQD